MGMMLGRGVEAGRVIASRSVSAVGLRLAPQRRGMGACGGHFTYSDNADP